MASYDETISVSLQQLSSLGMGDLSTLGIKGLPSPWGLIATKTGSGIQAFTCIGNLIGNDNQIVLVLGADWTRLLNSIALQGYPALRQQQLSQAILSDPDGSDNALATIDNAMNQGRSLQAWAQNMAYPCAQQILGMQVPGTALGGSAEIVSFNGPLQSLYLGLREELWDLMQMTAGMVTAADTELLICGQGVGAAFAQLAAFDFRPDKDKIAINFANIQLYTYSSPRNASGKFQALFDKSITDAWLVNAGVNPVVDFFPTEPTEDINGYALAQLGADKSVAAPLPEYESPWWERSGVFYTDVLNDKTTHANPIGVSSTSADGYDAQLSFLLSQLCAGAAQRAQHPQLAPKLPSSWSLVKAFPDDNPWVSVFHRPSPNLYAVVFRTDTTYAEAMNVLANATAAIIEWLPKNASVHGGAYKVYEQVRDELRSYLGDLNLSDGELVIAGHGLGAMSAMIAAVDLNQNNIKGISEVNAYCYGSPAAAGYDLWAHYMSLQKQIYLVGRLQDAIQKVSWQSLLTRFGTKVTLSGTTDFDGATYHPINSYIALLDPSA